jgi:hypothetical protein
MGIIMFPEIPLQETVYVWSGHICPWLCVAAFPCGCRPERAASVDYPCMIYSADRGLPPFIDKLKPIKKHGNRPLIVPWLRRESIKIMFL